MSSITDMLIALGSPDPAVRIPAEQAVTAAKETDLANFILTVLSELRDEGKPQFARHMAGTLLKNAVAPSFREVAARRQLEEKWKQLPANVRSQVKQEVLLTLGSSNHDVRAVVANIIGSLSRIELPAGEWPDLISILVAAVDSGSEQHQEAALTAIGYVCEEGRDHEEVEEALKPSTSAILTVIVRCMASLNEEVKYAATRALCNAMEYIHDTMEQPQQRNILVDALCTTAKESTAVRTRECAMESLVKVAELYYSTLPDYIARLHAITTSMIFHDEECVSLQALQFWISICETEQMMMEEELHEKCLQYAKSGMSFLVDICLQLLVTQEEDQDEDDWNRSIAGGKLLQSLAEVVGPQIHAPVMSFVYANINAAEWRQREAALMAFGCILGIDDAAAQEAIQDTVAQGVPGLLQYIRDSHPMVANTSAWVIAVVCENFPDVFLHQPPMLQQLLNVVGPFIRGADESMAKRGCQILHNLALAFEEEENQTTNELSPFYADLLDVLVYAVDNGTSADLKSAGAEALNSVVDAAAADVTQMLHQLVPALQQRLGAQLSAIQTSVSMEVETMAGLLCGAVASLARKLDNGFDPYIDSSMQLLIQILNVKQEFVQHEALVAIGSVAYASKARMAPYLPHVVPYVLGSLQNFDEPDQLGSVVGAIGDLCLSCGQAMLPYTQEIMNILYKNLRDPSVDRDLKCTFLSCFRDVILRVLGGEGFSPYIGMVMSLMSEMFHASCAIDIRGDPDSEEYVMTLWEATGGLYSSIIQSYQENNAGVLVPYLSGMLEFALQASVKSVEYPETMVAALLVIGDMASVLRGANPQLRQQAKSALLTPAVADALQRSVKVCSGDDAKQIKWVQTQLRHLERS